MPPAASLVFPLRPSHYIGKCMDMQVQIIGSFQLFRCRNLLMIQKEPALTKKAGASVFIHPCRFNRPDCLFFITGDIRQIKILG